MKIPKRALFGVCAPYVGGVVLLCFGRRHVKHRASPARPPGRADGRPQAGKGVLETDDHPGVIAGRVPAVGENPPVTPAFRDEPLR